MTMAWKLFVDDLRHITSNVVSILIMLGLVVIPGLFSWFNIAASWDPFGSTKNLKFAVASVDEGYRSDLIPVKITVGDQIVNKLRANDQLDWTFTSKQDAIDGTKSGKYYAAVIIPKDFSTTMMTFFTGEARHATLTYYTNEKTNALAPKVTGQGADQVASQVNTMFAKTLMGTALDIAQSLIDTLSTPQAKQTMQTFNTNIGDLSSQLSDTATNLDTYQTLLSQAKALISNANTLIGTVSATSHQTGSQLQQSGKGVTDISSALTATSGTLRQALSDSGKSYGAVTDSIDATFDSAGRSASDVAAGIRRQANLVQDQIDRFQKIRSAIETAHDNVGTAMGVQPGSTPSEQQQQQYPVLYRAYTALGDMNTQVGTVIDRQTALRNGMNDAAADIDTKTSATSDHRQQIKALAKQAQDAVNGLSSDFATTLQPKIDTIGSDVAATVATLQNSSGKLDNAVANLQSSGTDISNSLDNVASVLSSTARQLTTASGKLKAFNTAFTDALNSGDMSKLKQLLGNDPETLAATLAAPVQLKTTAVYKVDNFGASLTPFYTFIPLWVGSLLMCVTLKTSVSRKRRATLGDPLPHEMFLGRFGIFALISLLQSTFSCAGTLLFLRVHTVHPWLFMLNGWLSGLVYVFIIYEFVAGFGNIGKALGVILLVMQISGSGGAYPLQVIPGFINDISPFLPVTHSVQAARAAIAGIYMNDYWIALGKLLLFVPPLLLLGMVLRKQLLRFNQWYVARVQKTKLI